MPRITLNDKAIAALKPKAGQIDYFDHALPGFGVRVGASGRKTYFVLHRIHGRLQRLTLRDAETDASTYPLLSLAKARDLAREALRGSTVGQDVGAERKLARQRTFGTLADDYLAKHARRKKRTWRDDARMIRIELKAWRDRPVTSIKRADVRELLEAIVDRGAPVLANRVLALVRKIFNFALDVEWIEANPAAKMARPSAEQSRDRVLTTDEIRSVWAWLSRDVDDEDEQSARLARLNQAALKLRLITAQRGGEVIAMRWSDVDLASGWWTIPAEHSKNKLQHRVPLNAMALSLLKGLRKTAGDEAVFVFAGIRGTNHRHGALDGIDVADLRPHDFRRTAASLMASGGIARLVIGKVLNHVDRSITAVYDRHSYDSEKRAALDWWGRTLQATIKGARAKKLLPFARA